MFPLIQSAIDQFRPFSLCELSVARLLKNAGGVATMCFYRMAYGTNTALSVSVGTVHVGQLLYDGKLLS